MLMKAGTTFNFFVSSGNYAFQHYWVFTHSSSCLYHHHHLQIFISDLETGKIASYQTLP